MQKSEQRYINHINIIVRDFLKNTNNRCLLYNNAIPKDNAGESDRLLRCLSCRPFTTGMLVGENLSDSEWEKEYICNVENRFIR